ncbi:MAG TPA: NAD-dependent epimerase/dehydratase family protein [Pseudomonadales bacterium]
MHIVVTGAGGFIGQHLLATLLRDGLPGHAADTLRITALDMQPGAAHPQVCWLNGSFADADLLQQAFAEPAGLVFHLAAVPSGRSEQQPGLAADVNVIGMLRLLDVLKDPRNQLRHSGNDVEPPRLVFASSIAVYGKPLVPLVTDDTLPEPTLTYGAHKVIGEVLVNDYARRNWIRGVSLRLPGIVARPPEPNGAVSIFFSDLIREVAAGRRVRSPVGPDAQSWLMSVGCCVRNLMHAATQDFDTRRTFMLPALHVSVGDLVQSAALHGGHGADALVDWQPDPWVQYNFGSYPPIALPLAERAGFRADASLDALVADALRPL